MQKQKSQDPSCPSLHPVVTEAMRFQVLLEQYKLSAFTQQEKVFALLFPGSSIMCPLNQQRPKTHPTLCTLGTEVAPGPLFSAALLKLGAFLSWLLLCPSCSHTPYFPLILSHV